jgi:hypothetical protein
VRQLEADYDARHRVLLHQYESIMQAQKVDIDEIPLPNYLPGAPGEYEASLAAIELPSENLPPYYTTAPPVAPPKSILKPSNVIPQEVDLASIASNFPRAPPGPPPSVPPNLADFECDDEEFEPGTRADESRTSDASKKIRFGGEFTAPVDSTLKATSAFYQQPKPVPVASNKPAPMPPVPPVAAASAVQQPYGSYQNYPAPPPPPPPHQQQQQSHSIQASSQYARLQQLANKPSQQSSYQSSGPATTTIEAKPVLRNKAAETTKFVPTSLLIRRDTNKKPDMYHSNQEPPRKPSNYYDTYQDRYSSSTASYYSNKTQSMSASGNNSSNTTNNTKSTDEDYEKFMNEIGKLL